MSLYRGGIAGQIIANVVTNNRFKAEVVELEAQRLRIENRVNIFVAAEGNITINGLDMYWNVFLANVESSGCKEVYGYMDVDDQGRDLSISAAIAVAVSRSPNLKYFHCTSMDNKPVLPHPEVKVDTGKAVFEEMVEEYCQEYKAKDGFVYENPGNLPENFTNGIDFIKFAFQKHHFKMQNRNKWSIREGSCPEIQKIIMDKLIEASSWGTNFDYLVAHVRESLERQGLEEVIADLEHTVFKITQMLAYGPLKFLKIIDKTSKKPAKLSDEDTSKSARVLVENEKLWKYLHRRNGGTFAPLGLVFGNVFNNGLDRCPAHNWRQIFKLAVNEKKGNPSKRLNPEIENVSYIADSDFSILNPKLKSVNEAISYFVTSEMDEDDLFRMSRLLENGLLNISFEDTEDEIVREALYNEDDSTQFDENPNEVDEEYYQIENESVSIENSNLIDKSSNYINENSNQIDTDSNQIEENSNQIDENPNQIIEEEPILIEDDLNHIKENQIEVKFDFPLEDSDQGSDPDKIDKNFKPSLKYSKHTGKIFNRALYDIKERDYLSQSIKKTDPPTKQKFNCTHCDRVYSAKASLFDHLKKYHKTIFECGKCFRKFNSHTDYKRHNCGQCPTCNHDFKKFSQLKRHFKSFPDHMPLT